MRPVDKGVAPQSYPQYRCAQRDLVERIGDYCSYCERQIETNLAVEHIQPKSRVPALHNKWSNFLLACVNCNSCKGSRDIDLTNFFWPDFDNTLLAFDYLEDGRLSQHPSLAARDRALAQATIELFGLDREPGHPDSNKHPTSSDIRWRRRREAWQLALGELSRLQREDTTNIRELIVKVATGRGLFSIWMKVFENDSDMRKRLIQGFKGTAENCFNSDGKTIPRPGGQI